MNNIHHKDTFYDVREMSLEDKINICKEVKELAYEWWVDKLDCSESWARQKIDMSFEDILDKLTDGSHFVVIHRRGYDDWKNNREWFSGNWCLEVGFTTMKDPSHYLWLHAEEKHIGPITEKYNLKPLEYGR